MPHHPLVFVEGRATIEVGIAAPPRYTGARNPPRTWTALIDTGANMSVISPAAVAASMPPELGYFMVGRAGGFDTPEATYDIRLRLGGHRDEASHWFRLEVVGLQPATPHVDVILGTDLLLQLELSWRGPQRSGFLEY